ncbi:sensor histidine kinase [Nocardia sp. NPDC059246]|uniref:sensor histidine kinase n=1 Tax=unclassified Nocardia TaxID=2637762 RepID=UPI0036951011
MSSSPRTDVVSAGRRRWSLRARLLVGQMVLLVVVVSVVGIATGLALQQFLVHQVDTGLIDLENRAVGELGGGPAHSPPSDDRLPPDPPQPSGENAGPGPAFLNRPGIQPGTIGALVAADKTVSAGRIGADGTQSALSETAQRRIGELTVGQPTTLNLDGAGRYRVIAAATWSGQTVVTAMPLAAVDAIMVRMLLILLIATAVVLAVATTLGIWLIGRALAPLHRVAITAERVADLQLDRGEVELPVRVPAVDADPRTEVGKLGAAINRMLDHIVDALSARHASETRVRQFLADASHELRTPLSAIRGYAELAQRIRAEVPDVIANAMSRVDSESKRMTTLLEDMLLLARLDDGRALETAPVDLVQLTVDAISDAHIAGPTLNWELDLPDEPVIVVGDAARLHQVLSNILTNARIHTGKGTTVIVSLAVDDDGGAVWRVTDDGPGIPAELQGEIFERFVRGDSSRSRRAGSTGLGLAIVAAVVKAHDGEITVDSVPGRTVFHVHLPGAPS